MQYFFSKLPYCPCAFLGGFHYVLSMAEYGVGSKGLLMKRTRVSECSQLSFACSMIHLIKLRTSNVNSMISYTSFFFFLNYPTIAKKEKTMKQQ